ncbi:MAG: choice-of-anchor Q domain-containing protein [Candidatus Zhuqueibacterota bacterium]
MKRFHLFAVIVNILFLLALSSPPLHGAILEIGSGHSYATVTDALLSATDGDTLIVFGTITDYNISVEKHVTIRGENPLTSVIQASDTGADVGRRVFLLSAGYQIHLKNLTIRHGNTNENGAGIYSQADLTLRNCIIRKNSGVRGGGVYSKTGSMTIAGCDIRENTSQYDGAGIFCRDGHLTIENSTIAGNSILINSSHGGGLFMQLSKDPKNLAVTNCTISGNAAGNFSGKGGGVSLHAMSSSSAEQESGKLSAMFTNVTIADNSAGGVGKGIFAEATDTSFEAGVVNLTLKNCILDNGAADNFATSGDGAFNLVRSYSICRDASLSDVGDGNFNDTDPLLEDLADNGGMGKTHALLFGSAAINSGTADGAPATDQRGFARIGTPDMGSFESQDVPVYTLPDSLVAKGGQQLVFNVNVGNVEAMRGFDIYVQFDPAHFTNPIFAEGAFLSSTGDLTFWQATGDNGQYRVNCAILGPTEGKAGSGTLFTVTVTTAETVPGGLVFPAEENLQFPDVDLRDVNNNPIPGSIISGAKIIIDTAAPTMQPVTESQNTWRRSAPVFSSLVFRDNLNLQKIEYKLNDGAWTILADAIADSVYRVSNWVTPNFSELSENIAPHTVYWRAVDDLDYQSGDADWVWRFKKDVSAPAGNLTVSFSEITSIGMKVTGAAVEDAFQGDEYYEFDCVTDESYDQARILANREMTCSNLTPNRQYQFRYRVSDGVNDPNATPACNETAWSETFSTYTLSVAPTYANITCDKSGVVNTAAFTFTAVGGYGQGKVEYYRFVWDTSNAHTWTDTEAIWQDSTLTCGASQADINYYLHIKGYNAAHVGNGTLIMGPYQWNGTPITPIADLTYGAGIDSANIINMNWENPGPEIGGVEVWVKAYGGYPQYTGFVPTMPANTTAADNGGWINVYDGVDSEFEFIPDERDFYYCAIFVRDVAGHYSSAICDSSLSYWLGDVDETPDGDVDMGDVDILRNALGSQSGDANWNPVCDVGPTVKHTRLSRPLPDQNIDFEDVMIFSMNYDNTNYDFPTPEPPSLTDPVVVKLSAWFEANQFHARLDLENNPAAVKGLCFTLELKGLHVASFEKGDLWTDHYIFEPVEKNGQVIFTGAALGHDAVIQGNGTIGTAVMDILSDSIDYELTRACVRSAANTDIDVTFEYITSSVPDENAAPSEYQLCQNYPNPFNPATSIRYGLKERGLVKLTLYNVNGQAIKTLFEGEQQAGYYTYQLQADQLPSGVYFYKIEVNDFTEMKKMMLVK